MRFSHHGSVAIAMVASLASAAPHSGNDVADVSVGVHAARGYSQGYDNGNANGLNYPQGSDDKTGSSDSNFGNNYPQGDDNNNGLGANKGGNGLGLPQGGNGNGLGLPQGNGLGLPVGKGGDDSQNNGGDYPAGGNGKGLGLPDTNGVVPGVPVPGQGAGLPNTNGVVPGNGVGLPDTNGLGVPNTNGVVPGNGVGVPDTNGLGLPSTDGALPGNGLGLPNAGSAVPGGLPNTNGVLPGNGVGLPDTNGLGLPDTNGLPVPGKGVGILDANGLLPDTNGLVPGSKGVGLPGTDGLLPGTKGVGLPDTNGLGLPTDGLTSSDDDEDEINLPGKGNPLGLPDDLLEVSHSKNPLDLSKPVSVEIELEADLSGKTLVAGVLADVAVSPVAEAAAGAEVSVVCHDCHVEGEIEATISLVSEAPALSLTLKDVDVLLDLDVHIGAAATIAVNLVSPNKVSLPVPGLNVDALVYLDLVLGVHTELDLSAGVYVSLPESSISTDILNGNILDTDFSGVTVKVLPITVRIGCTELLADLRLRVELGVSAGVDANEVVPLGDLLPGVDIPNIGAGVEVAVYANLLEYIGLFCATPDCPLQKESYGLNVGAAAQIGVQVDDLLAINLAPTVSTALLSIPTQTVCLPKEPYTPIATSTITGAVPAIPTPTGLGTAVGPSGAPSGYPAGILPTGVLPTGALPLSLGAVTTPAPGAGPLDSINSVIGEVQTFTVGACAVNMVGNCPDGFHTSVTLVHAAQPSGIVIGAAHDISSITEQVNTMTPCSSTTSFVAPAEFTAPPFPVYTAVPTGATGASTTAGVNVGVASGVPSASGLPVVGSVPAGGLLSGASVPTNGLGKAGAVTVAGVVPSGGVQPTGVPTGAGVPVGNGVSTGSTGSSNAYSYSNGNGNSNSNSNAQSDNGMSYAESYSGSGSSDSYPPQDKSNYPPTTPAQPAGPGGYPVPAANVGHAFAGGNGTHVKPNSWSTSLAPGSATSRGPAGANPTGPLPSVPVTAGVGKVSSSIAAVVAFVGAVLAL